MAIAGAPAPPPKSISSGGSKAEPRKRRATAREAPPSVWRKTTQENELSSSIAMSTESAGPPASVPSCGYCESAVPSSRRANTRPPSIHTASALPSAPTATRGAPAIWFGSMSSGAASASKRRSNRRAARTSPPAPNTAYAVPLAPMSASSPARSGPGDSKISVGGRPSSAP